MKKMLKFAADMKNLSLRIFAAILLVWYSLSIIGFGIHTCSENNRSFLTSFIDGSSCEDIHPSELCGHSCCSKPVQKVQHKCCCSHHDDEHKNAAEEDELMLAQKKCCYNDYQQLDITGSGLDRGLEQNEIPVYSYVCCMVYPSADDLFSYSVKISPRTVPDRYHLVGEMRPLLSVWRI